MSAEVSGVYKDGELREYKSIRHPVPVEMKMKMQAEYDRRRLEEEGMGRAVYYLTKANIEKLERLASETGESEEDLINQAVTKL